MHVKKELNFIKFMLFLKVRIFTTLLEKGIYLLFKMQRPKKFSINPGFLLYKLLNGPYYTNNCIINLMQKSIKCNIIIVISEFFYMRFMRHVKNKK